MTRNCMHLLGAGLLFVAATPAVAELSFCNETDVNASIAIGYLAGDEWASEGWWTAQPGQCVTAVDAPPAQAYYYWHAVNENGEFAADAYFFCAVDDVFTIIGDEDCEARGHNRIAFNEVQIGADGGHEVRLTAALAPKPAVVRKTAEPEAAPEPAPELTPQPAEAEAASTFNTLPQPSFTLKTDIPAAELLNSRPLDFPAIKAALQGEWAQEGSAQSTVIDAKRFEDFEDGSSKATGSWRLAATCPDQAGIGPGIFIRYDENPGQSLCMILTALSENGFTLRDPSSGEAFDYTR
ncbi:MAG: DUF1036 domain-containing protein [Pseudomonadota bacterium]